MSGKELTAVCPQEFRMNGKELTAICPQPLAYGYAKH